MSLGDGGAMVRCLLNTDHLEAILGLWIHKLRTLDLNRSHRRDGGQKAKKGSEKLEFVLVPIERLASVAAALRAGWLNR